MDFKRFIKRNIAPVSRRPMGAMQFLKYTGGNMSVIWDCADAMGKNPKAITITEMVKFCHLKRAGKIK